MDNKSCVNKHQYGLWSIDKDKKAVYRTCNKCGYSLNLPITEEVIIEITKQEEASKIFKAFQLVDNSDDNISNYLNLILEDYINYLNKNDYKTLLKRIKELEALDIIDTASILYLQKLDTSFIINDEDSSVNNIEIIDNELAYEQT